MKLINGRQNQLKQPDIVMGAMENAGFLDNENLKMVTARMMFPQTSTVQINNTVFIYNTIEKNNLLIAQCSIFNVDVKELFAKNIFRFCKILQDRELAVAVISTSDANFTNAALRIKLDLEKHNMRADVITKDNVTTLSVLLNNKKYKKSNRNKRKVKRKN